MTNRYLQTQKDIIDEEDSSDEGQTFRALQTEQNSPIQPLARSTFKQPKVLAQNKKQLSTGKQGVHLTYRNMQRSRRKSLMSQKSDATDKTAQLKNTKNIKTLKEAFASFPQEKLKLAIKSEVQIEEITQKEADQLRLSSRQWNTASIQTMKETNTRSNKKKRKKLLKSERPEKHTRIKSITTDLTEENKELPIIKDDHDQFSIEFHKVKEAEEDFPEEAMLDSVKDSASEQETEVYSDNKVLAQETQQQIDLESMIGPSEKGLDVEETALDLFNKIFLDTFERIALQQKQFDAKTSKFFITKSQYEEAVREFGRNQGLADGDDNIAHLLYLFYQADKHNTESVTKQDIISVFRSDLKIHIETGDDGSHRISSHSSVERLAGVDGKPLGLIPGGFRENSEIPSLTDKLHGSNLIIPKSSSQAIPTIQMNLKEPRNSFQVFQSGSVELSRPKKGGSAIAPTRSHTSKVTHELIDDEQKDFVVKELQQRCTENVQNDSSSADVSTNNFLQQMDQAFNEAASQNDAGSARSDQSYEAIKNFVDLSLIEKKREGMSSFTSPPKLEGSGVKIKNFDSVIKKDLLESQKKKKLNVTAFELDPQYCQSTPMSYSHLKKKSISNLSAMKPISQSRIEISSSDERQDSNEGIHQESPVKMPKTSLLEKSRLDSSIDPTTAEQIFSIMFAPHFKRQNGEEVIFWSNFQDIIAQAQSGAASKEAGDFEKQLLKSLFLKGDIENKGFLTKAELVQAINQDLRNAEGDQVEAQISQNLDLRIESCNTSKEEVFCSSSLSDPVVKMMEGLLSKDLGPVEKCQNLLQLLEYIELNRMDSLASNPAALASLVETMGKYTRALMGDIQGLEEDNQFKNQILEVNQEMEGQIDQLLCDIENLRTYESSFHDASSRLNIAIEKNQDLEVERDNLNQVNKDLLEDLSQVKQQFDQAQMKIRCDQLVIQEQKIQISKLKEALMKKQQEEFQEFKNLEDDFESEEFDSDLSQSHRVHIIQNFSDDEDEGEGGLDMDESSSRFPIPGSIEGEHEDSGSKMSGLIKSSSEVITTEPAGAQVAQNPGFFSLKRDSFKTNGRSMIHEERKTPNRRTVAEPPLTKLPSARSYAKADDNRSSTASRHLVFSNPIDRINTRISHGGSFHSSNRPENPFRTGSGEQDVSMTKESQKEPFVAAPSTEEESELLGDLESMTLPLMRTRFKQFITETVQIERMNLVKQVNQLRHRENRLKTLMLKIKLKLREQRGENKTLGQINTDLEATFDEKNLEIENLKVSLIEMAEENQKIKEEKKRLHHVNQLLENRIHIEKSEKQSFISDFRSYEYLVGKESSMLTSAMNGSRVGSRLGTKKSISKLSANNYGGSRMSSYLLSHKLEALSRKGGQSAAGKKGLFSTEEFGENLPLQKKSTLGGRMRTKLSSIDQTESRSIHSRYRGWVKNQTKRRGDEHSEYRGEAQSGLKLSTMSRNQVIQSVMGSESEGERPSSVTQSRIQRSSTYSQQRSRMDSRGGRVQVISDFDSGSSQEDSIQNLDPEELAQMNQHIQDEQREQILKKREQNQYDSLNLTTKASHLLSALDNVIKKEGFRHSPLASHGETKRIFSIKVGVFSSKLLKEAIFVIDRETAFLFTAQPASGVPLLKRLGEKGSLLTKPFNILDDVSKIKVSAEESHKDFLALRMRDMKKFGNRDHLILEVADRELLLDFFMEQAELGDDEIILEQNDQFSMLVNNYPVWFSFGDIVESKKLEKRLLKADSETLTGFLEVKDNKALNIFKQIFKGSRACWETMYFVLKGVKLFIYRTTKGQKYTKPHKVLTLSSSTKIKEIRKADIGGRDFVFSITINDEEDTLFTCAQMQSKYDRWLKALRSVITQLQLALENNRTDDSKSFEEEDFNLSQLQFMEGALLETEGNLKQVIRTTPEPNSLPMHDDSIRVSSFDTKKPGPDAAFLLSSVVSNLRKKEDRSSLPLVNPSAETVKEIRALSAQKGSRGSDSKPGSEYSI